MVVRLAIPRRHAEALTSRPLLLTAVDTQTRHQGQTKLTLTSDHAQTDQIQRSLRILRGFFAALLYGRPLPLRPDSLSRPDNPESLATTNENAVLNCRF